MPLNALRVSLIASAIMFEIFLPNAAMILMLACIGIAGVYIVDCQQRRTAKKAMDEGHLKGVDATLNALRCHPPTRGDV